MINLSKTTKEERIEEVKQLTSGRGADLVVGCAGKAEAVIEGLEMTRRGGMYIETGNLLDSDEVKINPCRHLCAKNIRLIGMTNHPANGYTPSLKLVQKFKKQFPWKKFVTHEYKIDDAEKGIIKSMEPDSMKVVITP